MTDHSKIGILEKKIQFLENENSKQKISKQLSLQKWMNYWKRRN